MALHKVLVSKRLHAVVALNSGVEQLGNTLVLGKHPAVFLFDGGFFVRY
jgi:hypothetical protein